MGGYNSGRRNGKPLAEDCLRVDFGWMMRTGLAVPGERRGGTLSWNRGGRTSGQVGYQVDMRDAAHARLTLSYTRSKEDEREEVEQIIPLACTTPHLGGRRWWMICPYAGNRCGKLFLPRGGDRFASRKVWRVGYRSQRDAPRDRPFTRLNRLQRKLGCQEGYEAFIRKPKGMWHSTYQRLEERYFDLSHECDLVFAGVYAKLRGMI